MFILGFRFHPCTGRDVVGMIASAVAGGTRRIICNANLHGLASMYRSPAMAQLFLQDDVLVMIDSMPLLFLAWLRGRFLPRAAPAPRWIFMI
jgi:UDP-N-acetyl-D-mannosaminuronic acid transferase (WecB/TagA/CpsF family)